MSRKRKHRLTKKRLARLSPAERLDIAVVDLLAPTIGSPAGKLLGALGKLADEPPLMLLSAVVAACGLGRGNLRLARSGVRMMAAHAAATLLKDFGKSRITRSRPEALLRRRTYRRKAGGSPDHDLQAFPSGHTAGAVAIARALSREYRAPKRWYGTAAALGSAQLFRRAHFAGDVLAGAAIGVVAEALSAALIGRMLAQVTPRPT